MSSGTVDATHEVFELLGHFEFEFTVLIDGLRPPAGVYILYMTSAFPGYSQAVSVSCCFNSFQFLHIDAQNIRRIVIATSRHDFVNGRQIFESILLGYYIHI